MMSLLTDTVIVSFEPSDQTPLWMKDTLLVRKTKASSFSISISISITSRERREMDSKRAYPCRILVTFVCPIESVEWIVFFQLLLIHTLFRVLKVTLIDLKVSQVNVEAEESV
jgi:hypothetical protein